MKYTDIERPRDEREATLMSMVVWELIAPCVVLMVLGWLLYEAQ